VFTSDSGIALARFDADGESNVPSQATGDPPDILCKSSSPDPSSVSAPTLIFTAARLDVE
jgi:hypothetical protein